MEHEQKNCRCCNKPTPLISKTKGYRDFCNQECNNTYNRKVRTEQAINRITEFGFDYLGGYTHNKAPVTVRNRKCGHEFTIKQALNLFTNPDYCPTCGSKVRHEKLIERNVLASKK